MKAFAMLGAAALLALPALAHADDACPSGDYTVIRNSQIKPTGSVAGFAKAIADHKAWYKSHGYPNDAFYWGQVMKMDPATHQPKAVAGEYVTVHAASSDVPKEKHDAAWDAYVAEYAANSTITATTVLCMQK